MLHQILSSLLLGLPADLSNHDDALGGGVLDEQLQTVDEVCSIEGVAANTHTESLAQTHRAGLVHSLVGESAGPGDHAHTAGLVDVAGHDADLAGPGRDDAGTVGADQTGLALSEEGVLHLDHVLLGDTCTGPSVSSHHLCLSLLPSVIQTIRGISASMASRMAAAAPGGGT